MGKVEWGPEWNHEFLEKNPKQWLIDLADTRKDPKKLKIFIETEDDFTVSAILWKLGIDEESFTSHKDISFRDAEKEASTFIVNLCEDGYKLLVHEGFLYRSHGFDFSCQCIEITDDLRDAFDNPLENWEKITGISEKPLWFDIEYFF